MAWYLHRIQPERKSMFFGRKRQKQASDLIGQYAEAIGEAVGAFAGLLALDLEGSEVPCPRVRTREVRTQVEREMAKGAFLPAYRADYLDLLGTLERVADAVERATSSSRFARSGLGAAYQEDFERLVQGKDLNQDYNRNFTRIKGDFSLLKTLDLLMQPRRS